MNKAVPFLEKMFFKNNVNKIRQTIIGYLKEVQHRVRAEKRGLRNIGTVSKDLYCRQG